MTHHVLGAAEIFTLFFVTLGPLKLLGPFARQTHDLEPAALARIAWRVFAIATVTAIVGGFVGSLLLRNWQVSLGAMTFAGGLIFLLVALRQLLGQYEDHAEPHPPASPRPPVKALGLVFPTVLTPYGIAAVIALFAASAEASRLAMVVGLLVFVMVLNGLAMRFVRHVLNGTTMIVLQLLGAVLGVLQVALSVQMIVRGLRDLGVPLS